jgi:photosystem II stability/assembly factor-like uncharacterized protein
MRLRLAAALVLALALAAAQPAPGLAQRIPQPEQTITPLNIDFKSLLFGVSFPDADHGYAVGAYHSIFRTADAGQTWTRVSTPLPTREPSPGEAEDPSGQAYSAASFADADHGFAVSAIGVVVRTSNGGATWDTLTTPAPSSVEGDWPGDVRPSAWSFNGVSFIDSDRGYVVGHDGLILSTADGGMNWTYQGKPQYGILRDVEFVDDSHGQIVGTGTGRTDQVLYTTLGTNDGEIWQANMAATDDVTPTGLLGVAVTVPTHAVAVGEAGRIFVTFDEGKTWRLRRNGTNEYLYDVAFADRRRGIAVGGVNFQGDSRAIVLATNDAGEHWTAFPEPDFGWFQAVTFASPSTAYAVGCVDVVNNGLQSCAAAVARIDFPELDASVEQPVSSGGSALPFLLLGAAIVIAGAGLLLARRR